MLKGKAVTKIQQEDGRKYGPSCNWCRPGWSFVYGDYNVCNRRPDIRGSIVQFFVFGGMGARIPPQHFGIHHQQIIVSGLFGCGRLLHALLVRAIRMNLKQFSTPMVSHFLAAFECLNSHLRGGWEVVLKGMLDLLEGML